MMSPGVLNISGFTQNIICECIVSGKQAIPILLNIYHLVKNLKFSQCHSQENYFSEVWI